jgi:hypothetical protein
VRFKKTFWVGECRTSWRTFCWHCRARSHGQHWRELRGSCLQVRGSMSVKSQAESESSLDEAASERSRNPATRAVGTVRWANHLARKLRPRLRQRKAISREPAAVRIRLRPARERPRDAGCPIRVQVPGVTGSRMGCMPRRIPLIVCAWAWGAVWYCLLPHRYYELFGGLCHGVPVIRMPDISSHYLRVRSMPREDWPGKGPKLCLPDAWILTGSALPLQPSSC